MSNLVVPMAGRWPRNYCMGEPNYVIGRLLVRRLDKVNAQHQRQAIRPIAALQELPELKLKKSLRGINKSITSCLRITTDLNMVRKR